jgi:DNA replication and repair protein RecF
MKITDLNIHHLRNLSSVKLNFHPRCNLFHGDNGSGKTSLLEAIYLLSSGHSFRTREISPLISHGEGTLTVFARTESDESISIQKSLSGPTQVKLNRQSCYSSSELAHFLPCQVFYQDIFQIIDAGPSVRRTLLDWGLFHVEQSFHSLWKDYRMVIKQRNALLRQKAKPQLFVPWDMQLVQLANELHRMREDYFGLWNAAFQSYLPQLTDVPCSISYYKGWDRKESGKGLDEILLEQFTSDLQRQYTHSGAHQADLLFDMSSKKAKLLLSRGQQKIVLIALKLAQASLLAKECIYLFDDVAAELDAKHLSRLISCLQVINGQIFLTAMDDTIRGSLDLKSHALEEHTLA